ncbi:MAG: nitroreductase family protein [Firmicutes bacterium]|nr:nitroreductase family protein [Bacillota bacterium]
MDSFIQIITKRKSVRTYNEKSITDEIKRQIESYIEGLENPWNVKLKYTFIDTKEKNSNEKLGTYGVIRNANNFIAATLTDGDFALEALGYELEELILYLAKIGIGTCWLGGTFNRGQFAKEADLKAGEIIPVITPIGYPAKKTSLTDKMMRKMSKGDYRVDWDQLFFNNDFNTKLTKEDAGIYGDVLEMVRLGPSASNKQPWRIVRCGNDFHFFEYSTPGYSKAFSYDIQRIDLGIAASHFQLTAKESGLKGEFMVKETGIKATENTTYKFSWIEE